MSTGERDLLKHGDIAIGGGLACSTMTAISCWQLRPGAVIVVPKAASSIMGSHERGMKHTDTTGKTWSGSGKQLGTEGAGVLVVYLSPRDGRVLRSACETMSETSKAIEDL
jgi:hypothetical protein